MLDGFLAQTCRDFEILICDNTSSDRTPRICHEYKRRDSRIHVRNQGNVGAIANYNRVFELPRAPLFKWAAYDDLYHETYLDACVRLLEENPDIVLAHTGTAFIDEKVRSYLSNRRQEASSIQRLEGDTGLRSRP